MCFLYSYFETRRSRMLVILLICLAVTLLHYQRHAHAVMFLLSSFVHGTFLFAITWRTILQSNGKDLLGCYIIHSIERYLSRSIFRNTDKDMKPYPFTSAASWVLFCVTWRRSYSSWVFFPIGNPVFYTQHFLIACKWLTIFNLYQAHTSESNSVGNVFTLGQKDH